MKLLNKIFKKKQEKWVTAWDGDLLRVRESAFIKNAVVVKDEEGNYRAIKSSKK